MTCLDRLTSTSTSTNTAALSLPARWQTGQQLLLVTSPDWESSDGYLYAFEYGKDGWQRALPAITVSLGRNGSAWGLGLHPLQVGRRDKREGDACSPAGLFGMGTAFGFAPHIDSRWPYQPMHARHYCVDRVDSPFYNQIVDCEHVAWADVNGSSEIMRPDLHGKSDDPCYQLGLVIKHNPKRLAHYGSCIFAHVWREPGYPTAGCTAMSVEDMRALLAWLTLESHPYWVLLPQAEHQRLYRDWNLPPPDLIENLYV